MELLENIKEGKYRNQCRNFINKQKKNWSFWETLFFPEKKPGAKKNFFF